MNFKKIGLYLLMFMCGYVLCITFFFSIGTITGFITGFLSKHIFYYNIRSVLEFITLLIILTLIHIALFLGIRKCIKSIKALSAKTDGISASKPQRLVQ